MEEAPHKLLGVRDTAAIAGGAGRGADFRRGAITTAAPLAMISALVLLAALGAGRASADTTGPPPPSRAQCAASRAHRFLAPIQSYAPSRDGVRVFAIQFKQEIRHVRSYASYHTAIECLIRRLVVPHLSAHEPNVVALNEDVGLMTIGTGSRGAAARAIIDNPTGSPPSCEPQGVPCGTLATLAAIDAGYARELSYYRARYFPALDPLSGAFVAATDTFARGFATTFSQLARRYHVYVLGSNDQAPFRVSRDPLDIDALADPDLPRPRFVYVATSDHVYNQVFLWGPRDVRRTGPPPLRNVLATNRKVPLTPIEQELHFTPGPATGRAAVRNLRPYPLPGSRARIGFATSLPAFVYGDPPSGVDPCSDVARYYMRCLDRLGANVVIQDEANPGRWAGAGGSSDWQPLEWMGSTWRAVSDPTVGFDYNVTPMMVGNLADLAFDGQSAITQRGLRGPGCHYVGNRRLQRADPTGYRPYAGRKAQFLEMAPWVAPDGPRARLRQVGAALAPGSRAPLENDYLETALIADLTFPPDPHRRGCLSAPPHAHAHAHAATPQPHRRARPRRPVRGNAQAVPRGGVQAGEGGSAAAR